ncbi:hypothetical protein [Streptomyces sp. W16]|uniref:hypothetical protein n=1 Tax=Streptomyces sp. W16 TaxID=3076631 RepID=UPI00295B149C|nr:hypothetical protein [Streptomyces sp. W16]
MDPDGRLDKGTTNPWFRRLVSATRTRPDWASLRGDGRRLMDLEPHLAEVVDQLRLVFPAGVREDDADYGPLLVILSDLLAERNLGVVVEAAFGFDRHVVRNRAAGALSYGKPPAEEVERLKERMTGRGWYLEDTEGCRSS